MDKVIHFEIPADNVKRADKFYSDVFGWKIISTQTPGISYDLAQTVGIDDKQIPEEAGAINGALMERDKTVISPVLTIHVENIVESLKKIEENGGDVVTQPAKVGDMGMYARFKDTEGNVMAVWENLKKG